MYRLYENAGRLLASSSGSDYYHLIIQRHQPIPSYRFQVVNSAICARTSRRNYSDATALSPNPCSNDASQQHRISERVDGGKTGHILNEVATPKTVLVQQFITSKDVEQVLTRLELLYNADRVEDKPRGDISCNGTDVTDGTAGAHKLRGDFRSRPIQVELERTKDDLNNDDDNKAALSSVLPRSRYGKVDLSYRNIQKSEADGFPITPRGIPIPAFRSTNKLRRVLANYIQNVQPKLDHGFKIHETADTRKLNLALQVTFSRETETVLRDMGHDFGDVVGWSWILSANHSAISIRRYIAISKFRRKLKYRPLPLFLCLQILRFDNISAGSLQVLWDDIIQTWVPDKQNKMEASSSAIFIVRMLRHARLVDIRLFRQIAEVTPLMLPNDGNFDNGDGIKQLRRLTHFYNRMLSLIALPPPNHPFLSVPIQQEAQLAVARYMQQTKPALPINREGYRAFVRLQLRHEKTQAEQIWAGTKGPTWPPWRRDQLGIQENIIYPGQQSRALKVLQRMREAGYAPAEQEYSAQVFTGWDTDMSPTIQVRKIMNTTPMIWLKDRLQPKKEDILVEHGIWAARVGATRSVREAWLSFHSYMNVTKKIQRKHTVYEAMFEKLFARTYEGDSAKPGDGREIYDDPIAARDRVYIPSEPPSVEELYSQMLDDGIRPAGRLLAKLLDNASTVQQGFTYLEQSSLDETKSDVLRHAEKYPSAVIQSKINSLPEYLFTSFIGLLTRPTLVKNEVLLPPTSQAHDSQQKQSHHITTKAYALQVLVLSKTKHNPAYVAYLTSVYQQMSHLCRDQIYHTQTRSREITKLWLEVLRTLELMNTNEVIINMSVFRKCALIAQHVILFSSRLPDSTTTPFSQAVFVVKTLFMEALSPSDASEKIHWEDRREFDLSQISAADLRFNQLPQCKDIELLFFVSAICNDRTTVFKLLKWMSEGQDCLNLQQTNQRSQRQMMAAARIAVEGRWVDNTEEVSEAEIAEFHELSEPFLWAEDFEVEEFLQLRKGWTSEGRQSRVRVLSNKCNE